MFCSIAKQLGSLEGIKLGCLIAAQLNVFAMFLLLFIVEDGSECARYVCVL